MKTKMLIFVVAVAGLMFAGTAWAQIAPDDATTGLLDLFIASSEGWVDTLRHHGRNLLFALAGIWLVTLIWPHVFKPDLSEFLSDLVRFVLVVGFFLLLLEWGPYAGRSIIASFQQAGSEAAGSTDIMRPGDVAAMSIDFFLAITEGVSRNPMNVGMNLLLIASAILVTLGFGFIAVMMFVTLVESYIVINAAILFFGFGGSPWTRDYAITTLRYAMGVGAKLFVLILIAAVVVGAANEWMIAYQNNRADTITLVLLAVLASYLCKTIPDTIQGLITGSSPGTGAAIGAMATMALTAASAGMGAAAGAAGSAAAGAAGQTGSGLSLANSISSSLAGGRPGAGGGEPTPPKPPMPPSGGSPSGGGSMGGAMSRLASGASSSGTGATSSMVGSSIQGQSPSPGSSSQTVAMPSAPGETSATMESPASGGISEAANAQFSGVEGLQVDTNGDAETPDAVPPAPDDAQRSAGDTLLGKTATIGQAGLKGAGILSALTVPGMDNAAAVPGGLPPSSPTDSSGASPEHGDKAFDAENSAHKGESSAVENVIHPASQGLPEQGRSSPSLESLRVRGMASTPPAPSPEPKDPTPKGDA